MPSIPAFGTTTTIGADELPDEIRSVWTDFRNVSFSGDPAFLPNATGTAEAMPNAACVIVEGASHWANYEDPGSFNRIAGEFLTTTDLGV